MRPFASILALLGTLVLSTCSTSPAFAKDYPPKPMSTISVRTVLCSDRADAESIGKAAVDGGPPASQKAFIELHAQKNASGTPKCYFDELVGVVNENGFLGTTKPYPDGFSRKVWVIHFGDPYKEGWILITQKLDAGENSESL